MIGDLVRKPYEPVEQTTEMQRLRSAERPSASPYPPSAPNEPLPMRPLPSLPSTLTPAPEVNLAVSKPPHYQIAEDWEALDVIRAALTPEEFRGYCKGNFLKYRLRLGDKDAIQQDLDKSNSYRNLLAGVRPDGRLLNDGSA